MIKTLILKEFQELKEWLLDNSEITTDEMELIIETLYEFQLRNKKPQPTKTMHPTAREICIKSGYYENGECPDCGDYIKDDGDCAHCDFRSELAPSKKPGIGPDGYDYSKEITTTIHPTCECHKENY